LDNKMIGFIDFLWRLLFCSSKNQNKKKTFNTKGRWREKEADISEQVRTKSFYRIKHELCFRRPDMYVQRTKTTARALKPSFLV